MLTFVSDTTRRFALAERLGKNPSYLWQIGTDRRRASPALALEIERETESLGHKVPKEALRPDLWALAETQTEPTQASA